MTMWSTWHADHWGIVVVGTANGLISASARRDIAAEESNSRSAVAVLSQKMHSRASRGLKSLLLVRLDEETCKWTRWSCCADCHVNVVGQDHRAPSHHGDKRIKYLTLTPTTAVAPVQVDTVVMLRRQSCERGEAGPPSSITPRRQRNDSRGARASGHGGHVAKTVM